MGNDGPNNSSPEFDLVISVLNFCSEGRTNHLLKTFVRQVHDFSELRNISIALIVRDQSYHESQELPKLVPQLQAEYGNIFLDFGENLGFGGGHNKNFRKFKSKLFCVLNNDIDFEDAWWIDGVFNAFETDERVGLVGIAGENYRLNSEFGFGVRNENPFNIEYLDGSILFIRSEVFSKLGGFREEYGLAYFEDSDLCLRARASGYDMKAVDIPHRHFRSSSTSNFGAPFYSSLYENSRSAFFSKWGNYLQSKRLSDQVLVILDHDGIGDFFLSLYPLREFIKREVKYGRRVAVKIRHELLSTLLGDLPCEVIAQNAYVNFDDYVAVYEMGDVLMSVPFRSIDLFAAKLGVTEFGLDAEPVRTAALALYGKSVADFGLAQQDYVVCHFDNTRVGFAGRVLARPQAGELLRSVTQESQKVIVVGAPDDERYYDAGYEEIVLGDERIVDLRGQTSINEMIKLIASAKSFVGIDSGPSNIAQALNVPCFLIMGSVLPETKIYRENSAYYTNTALQCLGCYHTNVEPAYAVCYRRDEACMFGVDGIALAAAYKRFSSGHVPFPVPTEAVSRMVRKTLMVLMHNPILRAQGFRSARQSGKYLADTVLSAITTIVDRTRQSQHAEGTALEGAAKTIRQLEITNKSLEKTIRRSINVAKWAPSGASTSISAEPFEDLSQVLKRKPNAPTVKLMRGKHFEDKWLSKSATLDFKFNKEVRGVRLFIGIGTVNALALSFTDLTAFTSETIQFEDIGEPYWAVSIEFIRPVTEALLAVDTVVRESDTADQRELSILLYAAEALEVEAVQLLS